MLFLPQQIETRLFENVYLATISCMILGDTLLSIAGHYCLVLLIIANQQVVTNSLSVCFVF